MLDASGVFFCDEMQSVVTQKPLGSPVKCDL
jgi:hypothetical protein